MLIALFPRFRMIENFKIVLADTVVNFEECIDDVSVIVEHVRVKQLGQLEILDWLPRYLKYLLERVDALKEQLTVFYDHFEFELFFRVFIFNFLFCLLEEQLLVIWGDLTNGENALKSQRDIFVWLSISWRLQLKLPLVLFT